VGGRQQEARNKQRKDALLRVNSGLSSIKSSVLTRFNDQKLAYNTDLVLFYEDWELLSLTEKESAFAATLGGLKDAQGKDLFYYSLKFQGTPQEETARSVVANNEQVAASAVISMAWDIWRKETSQEEKTDLRSSYYGLQSLLSSPDFVIRAKLQVTEIRNESLKAQKLLQDCLVLKSYTLGRSITDLQSIVVVNDPQKTLQENIDDNIKALLLYAPMQPQTAISSFSNFSTINPPLIRSDPNVRSFIDQEGIKQENNQPSLFLTNIITEDVENSALDYPSLAEKTQYFDTLYPTDQFESIYSQNRLSLVEMYVFDAFWVGYEDENGLRGTLFCRHRGEIKTNQRGGGREDDKEPAGSACIADWYIATDLDYSSALAGI